MHFVRLTQPSEDQKIAQRIERGELSVYDFTYGGAVWEGNENNQVEPDTFYDPVRRTGTQV